MVLSTQICCSGTDNSVVIEDDGKVAYAYLLEKGAIVGDVWLYNCMPAPQVPDWHNPAEAPFLNPKEFVRDETVVPIEDENELEIKWKMDSGVMIHVDVFVRERHLARIIPGSKPGWCALAAKDGPLAKVLRV